MLGPISMVDVKVNNRYLFNGIPVPRFGVGSGHSNIVNKTEPVGLGLVVAFIVSMECFTEYSSVMTWWSCGAEGVSEFLLDHCVDSADGGSTSQ